MVFGGYTSWVQKELSVFNGVLRWWELRYYKGSWWIGDDHAEVDSSQYYYTPSRRLPLNWDVM